MKKPEELIIPEFSKTFKGYNTNEVDVCIDSLVAAYRELYEKQLETEEKLMTVAAKYKQASARAAEAMNGVKQMSAAIIADAQTEGDKIIQDARSTAENVRASMKESCSEILEAYSDTFESEKEKLISLENKSRMFRESLLEAYKRHIADIQKDFPELDAEAIKNINFESEVSGVFKNKLNSIKDDDIGV